jgi:hypothetical protein
MSGSIITAVYVTDSGQGYSIRVDKSSAHLINAANGEGMFDFSNTTLVRPLPPIGLIFRRIHCRHQGNPTVKRSFIFGNPKLIQGYASHTGAHYLYPLTSDPSEPYGQSWLITGYSGERVTWPMFINQIDSGLTDGTPNTQ